MESISKITLLTLSEKAVGSDRLEAVEREMPKVRAEPPVVQPTHMRRSPAHLPRLVRLRLTGTPYLVAKCDNPSMHALIERILRTESYDVVYLGHLGMAAYLARIRRLAPAARIVLEEHNVEWAIFDQLAPTFGLGLRQAAKWEAWSLRQYERRALRGVDSVIAISDADAKAFRTLAATSAIVVPTYVELGPPRVEGTGVASLAYTGTLGWQPNARGLDWFCKEVWPRVRKRIPETTLTIAGPGLDRRPDGSLAVPAHWDLPGIRTVGYVNDLEEVYRHCLVMVAPIVGGSGVRMKLLEAMRAGMPTVTTKDGAAGLDVEDGREMLITDDPDRFAEYVVRLLSDDKLRAGVRAAGYDFLRNHHSIEAARARLETALALLQVSPNPG
jgi:glycosyltransferase involved in cell wall biosynthesis